MTPTKAENETVYTVKFRMFSHARAITQREKNLAIYLADAAGRRFDPVEGEGDVPLNVQLGPGQSVEARRTIEVPENAGKLVLVVAHEGGFPISWFIIGAGPFGKPPILRLPATQSVAFRHLRRRKTLDAACLPPNHTAAIFTK